MNDQNIQMLKKELEIDAKSLSAGLESFIKRAMKNLEREGVILGLSGGIDSAVVAALCARAVGPESTLALIMPDRDSRKEHTGDARNLAEKLGIQWKVLDLTPYLEPFGIYKLFPLNRVPVPSKMKEKIVQKTYRSFLKRYRTTPFSESLKGFKDKRYASYLKDMNAYYRIKHRMRMLLLYYFGERENRLIVGAANRSEYKIGFFVKHGCDAATDIMPIMNLYKTQVKMLASYLKIPLHIIKKPPSPDIIPGIIDEEAIGIPYEKLDMILLGLEKGWKSAKVAQLMNIGEKDVSYVRMLMERSEHMRNVYTPNE